MNRIRSSLTALAFTAPLIFPVAAFAGEPSNYYPHIPGDANNQHVEYAPGSRDNVVGGGVATFRGGDNGRAVFAYGPGRQEAPAGVPVFLGVDDGRPVFAYAPAPQDAGPAMATRTSPRAPRG